MLSGSEHPVRLLSTALPKSGASPRRLRVETEALGYRGLNLTGLNGRCRLIRGPETGCFVRPTDLHGRSGRFFVMRSRAGMSEIVRGCRGPFRKAVKGREVPGGIVRNFLRPAGPSPPLSKLFVRKTKNPQIIAGLDFGGSMWESNPPSTSEADHWI